MHARRFRREQRAAGLKVYKLSTFPGRVAADGEDDGADGEDDGADGLPGGLGDDDDGENPGEKERGRTERTE